MGLSVPFYELSAWIEPVETPDSIAYQEPTLLFIVLYNTKLRYTFRQPE